MKNTKFTLIIVVSLLVFFSAAFFLFLKFLRSNQNVKGVAARSEKKYEKRVGTTRIILRIRPAKAQKHEKKGKKAPAKAQQKEGGSFASNFVQSLRQILDYILNIFQSN